MYPPPPHGCVAGDSPRAPSQAARAALVYSFGLEIVKGLSLPK